jgi:hypothetical protein
MEHRKNRSEKTISLRDLLLEGGVENQRDGKGEKRVGIQKNRRKKDYEAPYAKEERSGLAA